MATYRIVPTQEIQEKARKEGVDPVEYLENLRWAHIFNDYGDERRVDLEDIMIIRKDGTRVIVHELASDIEKFEKLELLEVDDRNKIIARRYAYADRVDFSRMQTDKRYLDCFGDELISRGRLASKQQVAQNYGLREMYIGFVGKNKETGKWQKYCMGKDEKILSEIVESRRRKKEQAKASKMIEAILKREKEILEGASLEGLEEVCKKLGIDLEEPERY